MALNLALTSDSFMTDAGFVPAPVNIDYADPSSVPTTAGGTDSGSSFVDTLNQVASGVEEVTAAVNQVDGQPPPGQSTVVLTKQPVLLNAPKPLFSNPLVWVAAGVAAIVVVVLLTHKRG